MVDYHSKEVTRIKRKSVGAQRRKKYPDKINVGFAAKTMRQMVRQKERLSETYDLSFADVVRDSVNAGLPRLIQRQKSSDDTGLDEL